MTRLSVLLRRRDELDSLISAAREAEAKLAKEQPCAAPTQNPPLGSPSASESPKRPRRRPNFGDAPRWPLSRRDLTAS